jgi:MipA family protein
MQRLGSAIAATSLVFLAPDLDAQETDQQRSDWDATVGVITLVVPKYPGSNRYWVLPIPMTQVTYRNRVYLGPSTSGVGAAVGGYAIRTPRLGLAAELGYMDSRPASRAAALTGMEDRDALVTAGASLSYRIGVLELSTSVAQGLNDGAGLLGTGRLSISRPLGRLMLTASGAATFADAKQMRREFGLNQIEATRRQALIDAGDERLSEDDGRVYRPDGGLRHLGASLSLAYILSQHWSLLGFGGVDRLSDEAAASPLVRRREQYSGGIGLGYRF